jgi:hypothetical protein
VPLISKTKRWFGVGPVCQKCVSRFRDRARRTVGIREVPGRWSTLGEEFYNPGIGAARELARNEAHLAAGMFDYHELPIRRVESLPPRGRPLQLDGLSLYKTDTYIKQSEMLYSKANRCRPSYLAGRWKKERLE